MTDEERHARLEEVFAESQRLLDPDRDAELREDLERRKAAVREIRYSEPRCAEPVNSKETVEFLTDAESAVVAQFVANGNAADYWHGAIREAIVTERALMQEVVAMFVVDALREQRQALEAEFKARMLELRADMAEKMCSTLATLQKVVGDTGVSDLPRWPKGNGTSVNWAAPGLAIWPLARLSDSAATYLADGDGRVSEARRRV
jgi:hypothetical protein